MTRALVRGRLLDGLSIVWLGATLLGAVWIAPSAPVTWDEDAHVRYGDAIFRWFATAGADPQALAFRGDSFYGGGYDLLGACVRAATGAETFVTQHLLGGMIAWLGLVIVWRVARRFGPVEGLLSVVLLCLTPVYVGHAFANPKDLPFAVGYAAGVLGLIRWFELERPSFRRAVGVGVLLGLAATVRAAGAGLLAILLVGEVVRIRAVASRDKPALAVCDAHVPPVVVIVAVAWAVMVLPWPWAWQNPIVRPVLSFANLVGFEHHDRRMLFAGEWMHTLEPRRDYIFRYLALKLPLVLLVGGGLGLWSFGRRPRVVAGLVVAAVLLPLTAIAAVNPVLYDGLRHVLFVVPLVCVIAAWGLVAVVRRFGERWPLLVIAGAVACCVALARQSLALAEMHPAQAVWFNEAAGGLPGAAGRYSLDYYGFSYREAAARLTEVVAGDETLPKKVTVEAAMPGWAARWTFGPRFVPTRGPAMNEPAPLFYVAYTRDNAHLKYPRARVVAEVQYRGVVLAVVKDLRSGAR